MSVNLIEDMAHMHDHYGVHGAIEKLDAEKLKMFLKFRIDFLQEELDEMIKAYNEGGENAADDTVDALIDLVVVALGTLDAFRVNSYEAWNRVYEKNMEKEVGVKASRPNPLGLPDLIKPEGWTAPTHADNVGLLEQVFTK